MIRNKFLATLLSVTSVAILVVGCSDRSATETTMQAPLAPPPADSSPVGAPLVLVPQQRQQAAVVPPAQVIAEAFAYHRVLKSGTSQDNFFVAYQNMINASKNTAVECFSGESEREAYCEQRLDGAMVRGNFYRTPDDKWSNIGVEVL